MLLKSYLVFILLPVFVLAGSEYWTQADLCKFQNGTEGRCVVYEQCPKDRATEDMPSCGEGQYPDTCCESRPEDFYEEPFGRIARKECEKNMDELFFWKRYGFVFGGKNAVAKEYTFMAALGYGANRNDIKFQCGGSLITDRHILTAAHCLFSLDDGPVRYVLLGELDMNRTDDDAEPQYFFVKNATAHPEYRRASVYHDIAILELDRPARFTEFVKPACLDYGQFVSVVNKTGFFATGWGYVDTNGNRNSHLQDVELVEYDFDNCVKAYPITRRRLSMGLQHTQMCAAGAVEMKDTCQGDSGGPLSTYNKNVRYEQYKGYIVVGVTSFGKLCGYTKAPGVYTRVKSYIPWIESVVWPDQIKKDQESAMIKPQIQASDLSMVPDSLTTPQSFSSNSPQTDTIAAAIAPEGDLNANVSDLTIEPAREIIPIIGTGGDAFEVVSVEDPITSEKPNPLAPRPIYVVLDTTQKIDWANLLTSMTTVKVERTTTVTTYTSRKPVNLVDFHAFSD